MEEYFRINKIDVGFAKTTPNVDGYLPGTFDTEVLIRKGKLRINIVSPALELTKEIHNGLLNDSYFDDKKQVEFIRFTTYSGFYVPNAQYNNQIECPLPNTNSGFEVYGFPKDVRFYGIIDVQEGYVKIDGKLVSLADENLFIPIEILKCFKAQSLLPKRKEYTLKEARKVNPLQVYHLTLSGVLNEFPTEILAYKNLESIACYLNNQLNFESFPEEIGQWTNLHTFFFPVDSPIATLPDSICTWINMEEFCFKGQLKTLPDSMKNWSKLRLLNVENNQLSTLPDWLFNLPSLYKLDIQYNPFSALSEALKNIPIVNLELNKRRLFEDFTFHSKNSNSIDSTLYDFTEVPYLKTLLEAEIDKIEELKSFKGFLVKESRPSISIVAKIQDDLPLASSKFGGLPDLPPSISYPTEKGKLYIFHAQINLKDIAHLQAYLPHKGMLYFFINNEEYAEKPCIMYHSSTEDLIPYTLSENAIFFDDYELRKEYSLHFKESIALPDLFDVWNKINGKWNKYKTLLDTDEAFEILNDFGIELTENVEAKFSNPKSMTFTLTKQLPIGDASESHFKAMDYELQVYEDRIEWISTNKNGSHQQVLQIVSKTKERIVAQIEQFKLLVTMVIDYPKHSYEKVYTSISYQSGFSITSRIFEEKKIRQPIEEKLFENALKMGSFPFSQQGSIESFAVSQYKGNEEDWFTLLSIDSFNVPEVCIWDAGSLCYCIHKQDLEILDFSKVVAKIESC